MPSVVGIQYGQTATDSWNPETYEVQGEASVTYTVYASEDECLVTPDTILATVGIPALGSSLSWFPTLFCTSRTPVEIQSGVWHVECKFEFFKPTRDTPDITEPWNQGPKWGWSSTTFDDVLMYSYDDAAGIGRDNEPIVNSAGTKFPAVARPEVMPVLTLKIPRLNFDHEVEMEYVNTVNLNAFWGYDPYQGLMQSIAAEQAESNGTEYWNVTYKIAFKSLKVQLAPLDPAPIEIGWRLALLDEGPEYKDGSGNIKKFKTAEGDAYIGNLNDLGAEAADGDFYWRVYNQYQQKDFALLGNMGPY